MHCKWDTPTRIGAVLVLRGKTAGSAIEMGTRKTGLKVLDINEEEGKKIGLQIFNNPTGGTPFIQWNQKEYGEGMNVQEFILENGLINLIIGELMLLDEKKNINEHLLPIWNAVMEDKTKKKTKGKKDPMEKSIDLDLETKEA